MKAIHWIIPIFLLTAYAPLELSRAIIVYNPYSLLNQSMFELLFIWVLYISAMVLIYKLIGSRE